jgi:hypothetical protein
MGLYTEEAGAYVPRPPATLPSIKPDPNKPNPKYVALTCVYATHVCLIGERGLGGGHPQPPTSPTSTEVSPVADHGTHVCTGLA